jgi:hypothetical protein
MPRPSRHSFQFRVTTQANINAAVIIPIVRYRLLKSRVKKKRTNIIAAEIKIYVLIPSLKSTMKRAK